MSTTIAVRHQALDRAVCDVYAASRLLHDSIRTAERRVAGLLADWQGPAAGAFATAFDEWAGAAGGCLRALDDIGTALGVTRADLLTSDAIADQGLTRIATRLGDVAR